MKLNKMSKEELELMPYTTIAELYLKENKTTKNTADLFKEVCKLLELSESDYMDKIADFFESLTTSKDFILLDNGKWDLKSNHKSNVSIEDVYEEKDELEDEEIEEIVDEEETEDIDSMEDDDNYVEDKEDDDLADLTIVNDEELEE